MEEIGQANKRKEGKRINVILFLKLLFPVFQLKLKLQYFGHLMQITDLFKKTLMLGKIEGGRRG